MLRSRWTVIFVLILSACQFIPQRVTPTPQPTIDLLSDYADELNPDDTLDITDRTETGMDELLQAGTSNPFVGHTESKSWSVSAKSTFEPLPIDLTTVSNAELLYTLSMDQYRFLANNGFVVIPTGDEQFSDIRKQVSAKYAQPYYLTIDAALHAFRLTYAEMIIALEREQFHPRMTEITRSMLTTLSQAQGNITDSALQEDVSAAVAYLAVALNLFDPKTDVTGFGNPRIQEQLKLIRDGNGPARSILFDGVTEDYAAYVPVGHYNSEPALINYYRGLTWLRQTEFFQKNVSQSSISRLPWILTWALMTAEMPDGSSTASAWARLQEAQTFIEGSCLNSNPADLASIMNQIYGDQPMIEALVDEEQWKLFVSEIQKAPSPDVSSTSEDVEWGFACNRGNFDDEMMRRLIADKEGSIDEDFQSLSGVGLVSVLGSEAGKEVLDYLGVIGYAQFENDYEQLQDQTAARTSDDWFVRALDSWLYALAPVIRPNKESYFPEYMQTPAWEYKEMNTVLGSWAELRRDFSLQTENMPSTPNTTRRVSGPAPAYVEPNPELFYRLAWLADTLIEGLQQCGFIDVPNQFSLADSGQLSLAQLAYGLADLANKMEILGDIAVRELSGEMPTEDERYLIQNCLGLVECAILRSEETDSPQSLPPISGITALSTTHPTEILQLATGYLDRILVVVPIGDELTIAQGGVYTYYEFLRSESDNVSSADWQKRVASGEITDPFWTVNYRVAGGIPADALAVRINDVYLVTDEGSGLNIREEPSTEAFVLGQLQAWDYVMIIDGPVDQEGHTWWKIRLEFDDQTGWVAENSGWLERVWE
jgi:hypothetical protein